MKENLPPETGPVTPALPAIFKLEAKKRSDKLMNYFLISYFMAGLIFALYYDTWSISVGVGGLCLLAYYLTKRALPASNLYQYVLSAVLGIFMAQYIYQMHGLFEMHFFAFIGSAILITYQNWKLQIPIVIVVVVHHAVFGYLQGLGLEKIYFTQLDIFNLQTFIIHVLLAAVIFFICGLWAYQLNKYSEIQISQTKEMERQNEARIVARNEQLEQHVAELNKAVAQGKFEIASDSMHDIGNAVVGFGSHLTRVKRLQDQDNPENLQNLASFFEEKKPGIATVIGEAKADAVVTMLSGLAEKQRNNQEEISKSIMEQINIIANITEILHIQRQYIGGHETQERKPVNLCHIINDTLALLFASIDKMAITVSLDVPADLPLIKGDRTKLMQVMLHVLKNSIEAIGLQGEEKTISLRAHTQAHLLALEVQDTGNGFDKEVGGQLFERGFTTKLSGSGLALYNCREIVESHAGTMTIASVGPGKGAVTRIQFKV